MNSFRLILRNLFHFRAANLAVLLGTAVATAVLTGALMVGDSVRGSLRDLAVRRLGKVDHALVATRFFPEDVVKRLRDTPGFAERFDVAPAIIVRGGAGNEDGTARTGGVQVAALGPGGSGEAWVPVDRRKVVVNRELAEALGAAEAGSTVFLSLPRGGDVPRESTLAQRGSDEVLSRLRLSLQGVTTGQDMASLFTLEGSQRVPRNAWVNLKDLQRELLRDTGKADRVNALLVHDKGAADTAADLNARLKGVRDLRDYGLTLQQSADGGETVIGSQATYIPPPVLSVAREVARDQGLPLRQVSVYLMNKVTRVGQDGAEGRTIHYAVAAGMERFDNTFLAPGQVVLNQWAADQLGAAEGDELRLTFFRRDAAGNLEELTAEQAGAGPLRVKHVVPMTGLGADPTLTPEYPGLTDAQSVSEWKWPPGLDKYREQVTDADEEYWDKYRAAPKLFLDLDTARKLWGGAYGDVTSLRVRAAASAAFRDALRQRIDPASMGMTFRAVKAEQLGAAGGTTPFGVLFVAFSFFLIAAAALLVAMLFRLNVEQRARQVGVMSAVGFSRLTVLLLALGEGMLVALIGALVGLAGAVGYTWLMVAGLRTWWVGAVGTTALRLHVEPLTLVIGFLASLAIAFLAVLWGVWRVWRTPPARLLAGGWLDPAAPKKRTGRVPRIVGVAGATAAVLLLALGAMRKIDERAAFLGGGSLLLVSSLFWLGGSLRPRAHPDPASSLPRLGVRNATRNTARSVLSVGLIAFAAFTLVAVASMKQGAPKDTHELESGAGGFRLILQADIPLLGDLNTAEGRRLVGISDPDDPLWARARFTAMRSWQGQDASCLNLTRPDRPTILSVPPAMVERKAFKFPKTVEKRDNPWTLLESESADGTVPVFADDETASYILKLGVGDTLTVTDPAGREQKLRLAGTLSHSIFQGELLMGEANFRRMFPAQSGIGVVLVQAEEADVAEVQRRLATDLAEQSVTVDLTADRLARYAEVANTYLSTFQTLGSLGLMLGTIGFAVVLLRGLIERRAELALLTALGFRRPARLGLVLAENAFLLVTGLAVGTGCALLAVVPALVAGAREMNLAALGVTLLAVMVVGLAALTIAVWFGQRHIRPADLRAE